MHLIYFKNERRAKESSAQDSNNPSDQDYHPALEWPSAPRCATSRSSWSDCPLSVDVDADVAFEERSEWPSAPKSTSCQKFWVKKKRVLQALDTNTVPMPANKAICRRAGL